ncbi:MAG TPA: hypothetical protein VM938_00085 [Acidimicrobiales bacterium]|nr:hypothetical protein [Acidimicrobiales bacterium]
MSHMVVFRSADGKPGYHQAESLDEAVRFVEHLRNQEGVTDTRLFHMQEIPLEVRTYYRVEVAASADAAPVVEEAERAVGMMDDPVVVEPMSGNGAAAGRFNRFNR